MEFREDISNPKLTDCVFSYDSITPAVDKHHKQTGWNTTHIKVFLNEITGVTGYTNYHDPGGPLDGVSLQSAPLAAIDADAGACSRQRRCRESHSKSGEVAALMLRALLFPA
jgi:hypothetical protein